MSQKRLMVQKSPTTDPWDVKMTVNNGIRYQPQLVNDGFSGMSLHVVDQENDCQDGNSNPVLLAQLERSREQLLESERSLRDVQVGWCTPCTLSPTTKDLGSL